MLLKYVSLFEKNVAVWSMVLAMGVFFFILMLVHFGEIYCRTFFNLFGVYLSDCTYLTILLFCLM